MKLTLLIIIFAIFSTQVFAGATGEVLGDTAKGAVGGAVVGVATSKVAQEALGTKSLEGIGKFFDSPEGVATMAGMATVYSGMLYQAAAQQEEDADQNIKKIDRVLAEFKDSFIGFCPSGHDDLNVPDCYCYLAKGGPNPDRTKSQTCQDLWAKNKYMLKAVAGDYNGISKFVDPVGCMTVSGQFDENCKCKKFLDSKGNNACAKSASILIPNSMNTAFATSTGLKDVMQMAANSGNGNPMFNNFSTGSLALKAIATDRLKNQLIDKFSPAGSKGNGFVNIDEKNVGALAKAVFGEKNIAAAMGNSHSALSSAGSSNVENSKIAAELKAAAAKVGIDLSGSGRGLSNKKGETKEAFAFNLNGDSAAANGAGQLQDFPEKEKTYKINSDISKDKGASIFDIISNRYIQSGLKRLFEE